MPMLFYLSLTVVMLRDFQKPDRYALVCEDDCSAFVIINIIYITDGEVGVNGCIEKCA